MVKSKFYRMIHPNYKSMRQEESINGYADHPYGLPGVECSKCGETWSSTKILSYQMPEKLMNMSELNTPGAVCEDKQNKLQEIILEELDIFKEERLFPGNEFQPVYLDIPCEPKADFLWSTLGSVLISERILNALNENKISGFANFPVIKRKVGNRVIKYPFEVPEISSNYFELIITSNSKRPPGADIISICKGCGREEYDEKSRKIIMKPDMWNGADIFFLNTTLWIIVTEKVKNLIESMKATNIVFEEI